MNAGPTELLVLRLGLIAVMFLFVAIVAFTLRGGLRASASRPVARATRPAWRLVVMAPGGSGVKRGTGIPSAGTLLLGRGAPAGALSATPDDLTAPPPPTPSSA